MVEFNSGLVVVVVVVAGASSPPLPCQPLCLVFGSLDLPSFVVVVVVVGVVVAV